MSPSQLVLSPGTSERMQKVARSIPPYDLLKAYREAKRAFGTSDVVLVVADEDAEGFVAKPRTAYVDEAFRRWKADMLAAHPLAKESAHKRMKMPVEADAFWLVVEFHETGEVGCCAIGAVVVPEIVS